MRANLEIQNQTYSFIYFLLNLLIHLVSSSYMQKQQFPEFLNISNIFNLGIQDSEHAITKKNCKPKKQKGKKIKQCQKEKTFLERSVFTFIIFKMTF